MRCLLLACLLLPSAAIFNRAANGQQPAQSPATGHAFFDKRQQIVIQVRCIDADADGMRPYETGLRPTSPVTDDLNFSTSAIDTAEASGVRLVSAKRIERTDYSVFTKVFENQVLREVIQTVQASERSNVSFAPTVKVLDGDTAEIFSGRSSWSSTESHDKSGGDSPQLRPLEDGTRLRLRASVLESGSVRLDFRLKDTHLSAPEDANAATSQTTSTTFDTEFSVDLRPETTVAVWGLPAPRNPYTVPKKSAFPFGNRPAGRAEMRLILLTPHLEDSPPAVRQVSGSSDVDPQRLTR